MIHSNRTHLLELKEKRRAAAASHAILKARRQALVLEFISTARTFLESRNRVRSLVDRARAALNASIATEGPLVLNALASGVLLQESLQIKNSNVLGVICSEVFLEAPFTRPLSARPYDLRNTPLELEEAVGLFEKIAEEMLPPACQEEKLRRIGAAVVSVTRKARILEDRVLPRLDKDIRTTAARISEREREEYFRRKRFKGLRSGSNP